MTTDSTNAPSAHTINPQTFLDYFTALGGGYCLTPEGKLWLGILQTGANETDRRLAAQLIRQITPEDAERIKDHIAARQNGEDDTRANWQRVKLRHTIAERAYAGWRPNEDMHNPEDVKKGDELAGIQYDAEKELIAMPAPDRPALLWKLEYLLRGDGDSVDCWSLDFVAQTLADCRRLLVEG